VTKSRWDVNGQGQTFAVIPPPGPFEIGSPPDEKGRWPTEERRRVRIDYPFAVAVKPVTVAEFKTFRPGFDHPKQFSPGPDTPINGVSWYDAAAYCNWLSEQDKIPKDQWCYEPGGKGDYAEGMRVKADYQGLSGYRLPREAEWEYACRAGTITAWSHGSDENMLGSYAWYSLNSGMVMHPVGTRKPNGLGLFDMHAPWQWCQEARVGGSNQDVDEVKDGDSRVVRGGAFDFGAAWYARSASGHKIGAAARGHNTSFRVARTYR
jgi:formylglycine-generating enzyme required for sulfatase activity